MVVLGGGAVSYERGTTLFTFFIMKPIAPPPRRSVVSLLDEVLYPNWEEQMQRLILRLGFGIQGSGFRVQGSGFKAQGLGFRVQSSVFRVQGSGFRVHGSGFRIQDSGIRV